MQKKVVIIDDDPISILVTETIMRKKGFAENIVTFERPVDALVYFTEQYEEGIAPPDYIFLDVQMPVLNGWEFLEKYEEILVVAPEDKHVVMLSATFSAQDREKANDHPMVRTLITKPVNGEILGALS